MFLPEKLHLGSEDSRIASREDFTGSGRTSASIFILEAVLLEPVVVSKLNLG